MTTASKTDGTALCPGLKTRCIAVGGVDILDIGPTAWLYAHIGKQAAINLWSRAIWAAPEPIPETIVDPVVRVAMISLAFRGAVDPEAAQDCVPTIGNAETLYAMCEDYRAGASIDLDHDAADADRPIKVPLLVASGCQSVSTAAIFDVQASWAGEGVDIRFRPIESGHFMAEGKPDETLTLLLYFSENKDDHDERVSQ